MAEAQNQVTLASGETRQLSDKNMALREKNLAQQASFGQGQPVQSPTPTAQVQTTPSQPIPEPTQEKVNMDGTPKEMPLPQLPAETKVELPKGDTAPKPVEIETPQDELNRIQQEVVVKGQIDTVKAQEKTGKIAEFTGLVQSGADTKTLADYARKNPALAQDFNAVLRNQFKNKGNLDFYSKYNGVSNDKLYASVKTGDVVVGDARYNLLPETQRQSFEAFQRAKDAGNVPQTKEELINFNSPQYKVDFTEIEILTSKMFNSDLKTKLEQARNDPRVVQLETQLNEKALEIEKFDLATIKASKTLKDELGNAGYTPAYISAMVRDDEEARRLERMEMLLEYNGLQANLSTIKADIQTDIELYKYEDEIAREQYKTMLELYETRRSEQVQLKSIEEQRAYEAEQQAFLEENKKLAEERQNAFQKELIKIQQDFEMKNQKPEYMTDRNGNLIAVINGQAQKVKDAEGEVVAITQEEKYIDTTEFNAELGQFVTVRTYKDGKLPDFFVNDIQGNSTTNIAVFDKISSILDKPSKYFKEVGKYYCGEFANNYLEELGITNIRMEDSYESKKQYADQSYPQVGGLAVWNPAPNSKYGENGHVGIVTGFDPKTNMVEITDTNAQRDGKAPGERDTYKIPVSQIVNSDGGFIHLDTGSQDVDISTTDINVFNSLTDSEKIKQQSNPAYKKFIETKQAIMNNPNSDIYDIIKYSGGGKELNATQSESITKFSQALNSIGEIQETISKGDGVLGFGDKTGPIVGLLRSANPYDVTAQQLKAQITSLIPNLARGVYGEVGVLTEQDVALYRQTVPNLSSTKDVNNAILGMTLRLVRNGLKENLQDSARAGFDTSLFEGKIKRIDEQVNAIESEIRNRITDEKQDTSGAGSLFNTVQNKIKTSDVYEFIPGQQ